MKLRKIICTFLAGSMVLSICSVASAAVLNEEEIYEEKFENLDTEAIIEETCDQYTISLPSEDIDNKMEEFSQEAENIALNKSNNIDLAELETRKEAAVKLHNKTVVEQAKEYVLSLNLQDADLDFIEKSCLSELEEYATKDDFILKSYTVNVPKDSLNEENGNVSTLGVSFSKLIEYGTYGGRKFYYYYPSTAVGSPTKEVKISANKSKLQDWVYAIASLYLSFSKTEVSVPWTLVSAVMGAPRNYSVKNGAYLDYYFDLKIYTRGIYTLYGVNSYEMVTSQQYAQVYPFVIFHHVDRPQYGAPASVDLGYQGIFETPSFNNKNVQLKQAWTAFNTSPGMYHDKVLDYFIAKHIWR